MACEECPLNNIGANRPPGATDDPCNTSGEGIFCTGSYWLYDPTAVGADTDAYGDCERLFFRYGDSCNVDEWQELAIVSATRSATAPTVNDCCQPGALWIVPTDLSGAVCNEVYMSTTNFKVDPPDCSWCLICSDCDEAVIVQSEGVGLQYNDFDAGVPNIPAVDTPNLCSTTVSLTNNHPSRDMEVFINFGANEMTTRFGSATPTLQYGYFIWPYCNVNAVLDNVPIQDKAGYDYIFDNTGFVLRGQDALTHAHKTSIILPPGATVTCEKSLELEPTLIHNADTFAVVNIATKPITLVGNII